MGNFAENLNLGNRFRPPLLFSDLEWIYHCLLPKTVLQMKRLQSTKFYLSLSAQIKQHNRYSSIINNFKIMNSTLILSQI